MIKKVLIALAVVVGLAILGFVGIIAYILWDEEALKERFLAAVNEQLNVPVQVDHLEVDIFGQFPDISLRFDHLYIEDPLRQGSGDTLLYYDEVYAQFGLWSVLKGETVLSGVTMENGVLNMRWEENGQTNFDILKEDDSNPDTYMELENLTLLNTRVTLSGTGENPWKLPLVAERAELQGVLDAQTFNANASWDIRVPEWNDQFVQLSGSMNFKSNSADSSIFVENGLLKINDWDLTVNGQIQNGVGNWTASANDLEMSEVLSLLPEAFVPDPGTIVTDGLLSLLVQAETKPTGTRIQATGDWSNGSFNASQGWIVGRDAKAHFAFDSGSEELKIPSYLKISDMFFRSEHSTLQGDISIHQLDAPRIESTVSIDGRDNLMDLIHWLEYPTWSGSSGSLSGTVKWQNQFESLDQFAELGVWGGYWGGALDIQDASLTIKDVPKTTYIPSARMELLGHDLHLPSAQIKTGSTTAFASGRVHNFFNDEVMHYALHISGSDWNADDISQWEIWNGDFTGEPDDEDFVDTYDITVSVDQLQMDSVRASQASGRFSGVGLHVESDNILVRYSDGTLKGRLEWLPLQNDEGKLLFDGSLQHVDVHEFMNSMKNFGQDQITSDQISGVFNANLRISAPFNSDYDLKREELAATVAFEFEQGRIQNFEPLLALSRFAEVEDLKDVRFGTLKNEIRIADGVVYVPEMTLENNVLLLKVAGKHHFSDLLDFTLQLQLRDLVNGRKPNRSQAIDSYITEEETRGPVWVPIKVYGPSDDLKFSIDKKAISQEVKANLQEDWKRQGEELKGLFEKPVERPVVPETKYQFEWEERPDTNRLFIRDFRSFTGYLD